MRTTAAWARRRQMTYILSIGAVFFLLALLIVLPLIFGPSSCFDGSMNGDESGVDCGGSCVRICAAEVVQPHVQWVESFEIFEGQYNAVAYIENSNMIAAAPNVQYTFTFYDDAGVITERSGETILPPDSVYPIFEGRIMTGGRKPTKTTITIDTNDFWQPAEVSSREFVLVGRELRNTDTNMPSLTARMRNDSILDAREVEVVATIFNSAGVPLTTSRTIAPRFFAGDTETLEFTWPRPIATTIRSCEVPTDVVLGIDLSGSMNNDSDNPPEPITSVLASARSFSQRLESRDQAGVVTYATDAAITQPLTNDLSVVGQHITDLTIAPEEEVGSTNTGDAIMLANLELNSARHNSNARKVFVLLTDGLANEPEEDPEGYALAEARRLKSTDTQIFTIGLGENVNQQFLEELASSPGHYLQALTTSELDTIYTSITDAICEDGAAVIEIIPKTDANFTPLR